MGSAELKINGTETIEYKFYLKEKIEFEEPEENIELIYIKGRDGSLTRKNGLYDTVQPIKFYIVSSEKNLNSDFRKAKQFIYSAKELSLNNDKEMYMKVKHACIKPLIKTNKRSGEFTVDFTLDPFQYEIKNEPVTITSRTNVKNEGYTSEPVIKVHAKGTGNLYIGQQKVTIKDVNGVITIDSEQKNAYRREGGLITSLNKHMIGKFPVLNTGSNWIHFDGDISKVEVIPNRRWV